MTLKETELFLLKEVLTKIKYDSLNERYTLYIEDYFKNNLTSVQIKVLRRICQENDIYLEELPEMLTTKETNNLFFQYNNLKVQLKNDCHNQTLNTKKYEIRNQIVEGHMKLIYKLIHRHFPEFPSEIDKEDIYQTGYECLIELVEQYDNSKQEPFITYVCHHAIKNIITKLYQSNINIHTKFVSELTKLKNIKKSFEQKYGRTPTKSELIKATNQTKKQIEQLLLIENLLEPMSLEQKEDKEIPQDLIDYEFENREINKILANNNHLNKIIDLLPESQRRIIRLYYGFEDGKYHSNQDIANIIGISHQRVQQIKTNSLYLLINSVGSDYLKDIYGPVLLEINKPDEPRAVQLHKSFVEDLFIESIPPEELKSIINELAPNYQEIIKLYYGLIDNYKYDFNEISKLLNVASNKIRIMKHTCVNIVFKKYIQRHNPNINNGDLQYIVNTYINNEKHNKK